MCHMWDKSVPRMERETHAGSKYADTLGASVFSRLRCGPERNRMYHLMYRPELPAPVAQDRPPPTPPPLHPPTGCGAPRGLNPELRPHPLGVVPLEQLQGIPTAAVRRTVFGLRTQYKKREPGEGLRKKNDKDKILI